MSENPWPSTAALCRKEKTKLNPDMLMRRVKEIHQTLWQQQMPDSDGSLSTSLLPASWWLELIQQWGRSEPKLMISLMESHCPTLKSCFFPPLISIYVQAALPSFPYFTPSSLPYSTFYPKRKTHKAMMFFCCYWHIHFPCKL